MKRSYENRLPKKQYFEMRLKDAIANGLIEKAQYFAGRLAQLNQITTGK